MCILDISKIVMYKSITRHFLSKAVIIAVNLVVMRIYKLFVKVMKIPIDGKCIKKFRLVYINT